MDVAIAAGINITPWSQWHRNEFKSGEAHVRHKASEKNFVVPPPHFFGSRDTISRVRERFCDGQYSLVSFLFAVFYSRCPLVPMDGVGATAWS